MAVPALLKSPYVMGSAGVVGVGGISIATLSGNGGIDYSDIINSEAAILKRKDLVNKFITGQWKESNRCFSEFFGSKLKVSFSDPIANVPDPTTIGDPSSIISKEESQVEACAFVQHSHLNSEAFVLQMEVTVRVGKVGLSLWAFGKNVDFKNPNETDIIAPLETNIIRYYLLFMEQGNEASWDIKGGYSWYDKKFIQGYKEKTLDAKISGKSIYGNVTKWSGISSERKYEDEKWNHGIYFGKWIGKSGSSGKEVFEEIEVGSNSRDSAEILGRDYSKKFAENSGGKGYAEQGYDPKKYGYVFDKGWKGLQKVNVDAFDKWYEPFRNKKGNWMQQPLS